MPAPLTYTAVGATRSEVDVPGYRRIRREARLGSGEALFRRAAGEVLSWGVQRRSGMRVTVMPDADAGAIREDDRAWIRIPVLGPFAITIPCHVVYVVREDRVQGFAYGTLLGHPESGEEAFLVEHRDDDSVWFVLKAFSRPASWFWWLGAPILRFYQERYTRRYLRALEP